MEHSDALIKTDMGGVFRCCFFTFHRQALLTNLTQNFFNDDESFVIEIK